MKIVYQTIYDVVLFMISVGHGESEGYRWDISDYKIYLRDLLQHINIIKMKYPDLPLYLFGHSMVRFDIKHIQNVLTFELH